MNIIVEENYNALSRKAAEDLLDILEKIKDPVICVASGDSPAGLYKELVSLAKSKKTDTSGWMFVGLDEWGGMNGKDEGSCRFHLNLQLFHPLKVQDDKIIFFDGRVKDPNMACMETENFILDHGGIDVAILGLGMNGHIGMNEPGTPQLSRSHYAELDPLTSKTGQKYFKEEKQLSHGLTLGIATLMDARNIMLIVNGEHKAAIVQKILEDEISEDLPGSLLRNHPGLTIYLDAPAAQMISI